MAVSETKTLNVGDKIMIVTPYTKYTLIVFRVTKTEAILSNKKEGYVERRFKREYQLWDEITGRCKCYPLPIASYSGPLIEYYYIN